MQTCAVTAAEQSARITATTADLTWIAQSWPDLYQLRLPGSRRNVSRRPMTRAARERADEQARVEKAEQGDSVLGASRAPMDVGVLDALSDLLAQAVELDDRVTMTAGVEDCEPPSTAYDFEALPRILAHLAAHLPAAVDVDPGVLDEAEHVVKRMKATMEHALTDIVDGQVLSTVCAWCKGQTTHSPAGGEKTLTVRVVAGEPLIVCMSDACEPPEENCGTWLFGKPAWHQGEWEWLSKHLGPDEVAGPTVEQVTNVQRLLAALSGEADVPEVLGGLEFPDVA